MLGLLLIYFIGKAFYDLAANFNKSKWGFAILGVVSYYAGTFIGGIIIALVYTLGMSESIDDMSEIVLGLIAIPFGLLTCWGLYMILKKLWNKPELAAETLDSDMIK